MTFVIVDEEELQGVDIVPPAKAAEAAAEAPTCASESAPAAEAPAGAWTPGTPGASTPSYSTRGPHVIDDTKMNDEEELQAVLFDVAVQELQRFARGMLRLSTLWKAENLLRPRYVESNDILISNVTEILESLSTVSERQELLEIEQKHRFNLVLYEYVREHLGWLDSGHDH